MTSHDLDAFFSNGWNGHDVDLLMTYMTDDCVFESTSGPEVCGSRHTGRERVREAFARVFATFPDARFGGVRHVLAEDRGLSEWTFTGTRGDGTKIEVNGCDTFTFRNGKIAVKSSDAQERGVSGQQPLTPAQLPTLQSNPQILRLAVGAPLTILYCTATAVRRPFRPGASFGAVCPPDFTTPRSVIVSSLRLSHLRMTLSISTSAPSTESLTCLMSFFHRFPSLLISTDGFSDLMVCSPMTNH